MDNVAISENAEAALVLGSTIGTAATTLIGALPIPLEIKAPVVAFTGTVTAAILVYWKSKVNKQASS